MVLGGPGQRAIWELWEIWAQWETCSNTGGCWSGKPTIVGLTPGRGRWSLMDAVGPANWLCHRPGKRALAPHRSHWAHNSHSPASQTIARTTTHPAQP